VTDTDFYLDIIKKINKFDERKLITTPLYIIEIDDKDIKKYNLNSYAIPKSMINEILQKYNNTNAKLLFIDLDISKYSCIDSKEPTSSDLKLIETLNSSKKRILLPFMSNAPIYLEVNNTKVSTFSVEFIANDAKSVKTYSSQMKDKDTVAYAIYKEMTNSYNDLNTNQYWIDEKLSNLIVYKEFDKNNSYYSGLSKISLREFLTSDNSYEDAIFLLGRVDKNSNDLFNTPIGVLSGIEIHANAIMSMYYYGEIKSYHLLSILIAFILGFTFSFVFELLKINTNISKNKEDVAAGVGIMIFSALCLITTYFLLERHSVWLDYQKVVFVFTTYEVLKIIIENSLLKRKSL